MTARVLVVDDVELNVKLLEAKLSSEYYQVIPAYNGPSALELADSQLPDIILLDVMMPRMDGFEVCRRLKANPRTTDIPVVMVTALSDIADRLRGLEAGADDFLTKPVNDIALFARVRSLVRLKRMMEELRLREDKRRFPGGHTENWHDWWDAAAADPVLAGHVAERARRRVEAGHHDSESTLLATHVEALRAAGFAEVGTLWQRGDNRLLCGVMPGETA